MCFYGVQAPPGLIQNSKMGPYKKKKTLMGSPLFFVGNLQCFFLENVMRPTKTFLFEGGGGIAMISCSFIFCYIRYNTDRQGGGGYIETKNTKIVILAEG